MSAPTNTPPLFLAALLMAGGLACQKPATVPVAQPEQAKVEVAAQEKAREEQENNRRQAEAAQKRQAEEAARAAQAAQRASAQQAAEAARSSQAALKDIHFEYDKSDLQETDKVILVAIADFMKGHAAVNLTIEGHCDERGTVEYNLALGERRAHSALAYLVGLGVPTERFTTVSYGKEKPLCKDSDETCWAINRRAHFASK